MSLKQLILATAAVTLTSAAVQAACTPIGVGGGGLSGGAGSGAGGGGAAVGAAGGGGGAGGAGAGSGGAGGIPDIGEAPLFEPFGEVALCPIDRLVNRGSVRLFVWETWGSPELERGVPTPFFDFDDYFMAGYASSAWMDETNPNVHFGLYQQLGDYQAALLVDGDGWILDAFRVPLSAGCLAIPAQTEGRHAVAIAKAEPGVAYGGVIVDEAQSDAPVVFAATSGGAGPLPVALGTSRWAWRFLSRIDALSAVDGSNYVTLSPNGPLVIDQEGLVTTGPEFFWNKLEYDPVAMQDKITLHRSDGLAPSAPWFAHAPLESFGALAYAHTHVGMMRGYNNHGINEFDSVEIWASPYSPGAPAAPYKVGEHTTDIIPPFTAGGFGRFLVWEWNADAPTVAGTIRVWDLVTLDDFVFQLPEDRPIGNLLGATPTHAFVIARDATENKGRFVVRQRLPW